MSDRQRSVAPTAAGLRWALGGPRERLTIPHGRQAALNRAHSISRSQAVLDRLAAISRVHRSGTASSIFKVPSSA